MSYESEHLEIQSRFAAVMGNVQVSWPNVTFTPPSPSIEWYRFKVSNGDAERVLIGRATSNYRSYGIIQIQVFVPLNTGNANGLQKADAVAAVFRNWYGATVRCQEASIKDIGAEGNGWYQYNVNIPFYRDEWT